MYQLIDFEYFNDKDSVLVALQNDSNCPFDIKRVFYIFDVPSGVMRGDHANRDSRFLFIVLKGQCKIRVDNGEVQKEIVLNTPKQGLYLDRMVWKQMYDFSSDCVLLVLSDTYYNKDEYIRDYDEFLKAVKG